MSKPKRNTFSSSHFRMRQMAANDRKFCIMWINKMVTKQVEEHIAELRAEFSLLSQELREQMAAEINKQLGEPVVEEARAHSQHYTVLFQEEEDEKQSLDQITLSSNPSETHCYIYKKSTEWTAGDKFRILLQDLTGSDSSDSNLNDNETMVRTTDAPRSSQQAEKQLMETQWNEWMDVQERTGILKEKPHDQQNSTKQEGPCKPDRPVKEIKVEHPNKMKQIRTYISDFFNPNRHYMWRKLEEDD